jgi:hypothetical protein
MQDTGKNMQDARRLQVPGLKLISNACYFEPATWNLKPATFSLAIPAKIGQVIRGILIIFQGRTQS